MYIYILQYMNCIAVHKYIDRYISEYKYKHIYIYTEYNILYIRLIFPPTPIRKMNKNFQPLQFLHLFWDAMAPGSSIKNSHATESPCGIDCLPFIGIDLLRFYRYWPEE